VVLAWSEAAEDRAAASRREYALKKLGREAKEELLRIAASAALRD
jgi:predicted GIY-YIG superfamily endonuclease